MRQIALYLPVDGQKQSRVNRVWRFFHKMKMEQKDFYGAFVRVIPKIVKNRYVIIDYTALRGYDVMLFIASMPYKGRSIPFYGKVLRLKDLDNLTYLSKNDFLECCMDEVLAIVPFSPVVIGDREFGAHWFLTYLEGKGVGYVIRIAKNKVVSEYGMNIEVSKLPPGKHLVQWRGLNFYIGKRDNPNKKDNFWIVAYSKDLVNMNSLHIAWTYLKRFQCEEMHKELKSRLNLLSLNKQRYYKEAYNTEIVNKFLMVLITAFFIGLYIGGLFKHRYKEHLNVIVSYEKE
ncbi:MAG: transposase, partial [Nitrospirae bacterium]|nr:transposase [Nitrospirota bacterium]